jgi:hypothetical protein
LLKLFPYPVRKLSLVVVQLFTNLEAYDSILNTKKHKTNKIQNKETTIPTPLTNNIFPFLIPTNAKEGIYSAR